MSTPDFGELSNVRFQIVKSMLLEFPELNIIITKEILIEGVKPEQKISLTDYLSGPGEKSILHNQQKSKNNYQTNHQERESIPIWAKFSMATIKQDADSKYYVFK
jgi:hypothetical protein